MYWLHGGHKVILMPKAFKSMFLIFFGLAFKSDENPQETLCSILYVHILDIVVIK